MSNNNPYRTIASKSNDDIILSPQWNISWWKKLYVRVMRVIVNIREPYEYDRRYKQYLRDLYRWRKEYGDLSADNKNVDPLKASMSYKENREKWRRNLCKPPMPTPPPTPIYE